jgi:hypothetical protein
MSTSKPCKGAAGHRQARQGRINAAAHAGQDGNEVDVPLGGLHIDIGDAHPAAGQSCGRPEIGGAGGVGIDIVFPALVALPPGYLEEAVTPAIKGDTERGLHIQGQVHVRPGNQLPGDVDFHPQWHQRSDEQEGRKVLAAHRAGEAGAAAGHPSPDQDGRAAFAAGGFGLGAQLLQGRQEFAHGPLAEAGRAGEAVLALAQGRHCGEKAHGGAGVAQVDRLGHRRPTPADAPDLHRGLLPTDPGPQLGQGLGRQLRIFSLEGVAEQAFPRGQGGGDQGPVRIALGAGQGKDGLDRTPGFDATEFWFHANSNRQRG